MASWTSYQLCSGPSRHVITNHLERGSLRRSGNAPQAPDSSAHPCDHCDTATVSMLWVDPPPARSPTSTSGSVRQSLLVEFPAGPGGAWPAHDGLETSRMNLWSAIPSHRDQSRRFASIFACSSGASQIMSMLGGSVSTINQFRRVNDDGDFPCHSVAIHSGSRSESGRNRGQEHEYQR